MKKILLCVVVGFLAAVGDCNAVSPYSSVYASYDGYFNLGVAYNFPNIFDETVCFSFLLESDIYKPKFCVAFQFDIVAMIATMSKYNSFYCSEQDYVSRPVINGIQLKENIFTGEIKISYIMGWRCFMPKESNE